MSIELVLARIEKLKRTGDRRWVGLCPAHSDRCPSLSISEAEDGRVLMHCFAGCRIEDVLSAMSLDFRDLMPALPTGAHHIASVRRPWRLNDALDLIEQEATLLAVIVADAAKGGALPESIKDRALQATGRLSGVVDALRG
jgi:hypothetical protein